MIEQAWFYESQFSEKENWMETLMQKLKPVASDSNLWNKVSQRLLWESYNGITPSNQILTEEFKAVVFERDVLEYQDVPTLKAISANQDSDTNVGNKFFQEK